jgi:hypothetical protein
MDVFLSGFESNRVQVWVARWLAFRTKDPNWGKFWRALQWKMLVYFMTIWSTYTMAIWHILRPFGLSYGRLAYFTAIWHTLRLFGIFYGHLEYFFHFGKLYVPRKI